MLREIRLCQAQKLPAVSPLPVGGSNPEFPDEAERLREKPVGEFGDLELEKAGGISIVLRQEVCQIVSLLVHFAEHTVPIVDVNAQLGKI